MSGELEHIIPTHPSETIPARRTRNIIWSDGNGNDHSIKAVYWSPTNDPNDLKLIWQVAAYVPYDNSCTAIISLTANGKGWVVTVEKDGEDVTSSFASMIPWIYNANNVRFNPKAKISSNTVDLSSFGRGEYRLDVSQITSKVGASSYFPSSGVVSAPDHVYIGGGNNLVADNQNVAIEYDLTNALYPVTVNSIEIFTDSSSNSSAKIKILHESGLFIAAVDGDTKGTQEERFGLNGYSHSVDNLSIQLYTGNKYYIVYQGSTNEAFYPSRFQNENGKYKVYANTTAANQITVTDIGQIPNFKGAVGNGEITIDNKIYIFSTLSINDTFLWTGNHVTVNNQNVLITNHIYELTNKSYPNADVIDITSGSGVYKGAKLIGNLGVMVVGFEKGYVYNSYSSNKILKIKSGFSSQIQISNKEPTLMTTLPTSPVENGIYYIERSIIPNQSSSGAVLALYSNNYWDVWTEEQWRIDNVTEEVTDIWNDIADTGIQGQVAQDFLNASLNTDKHFYLKINGMEV